MPTDFPQAGRHRGRRALLAFAAALAMFGSGCTTADVPLPGPATPSPTAIVPPLTGVTRDADTLAACADSGGSRLAITGTQIGQYDSWQELSSDLPLNPEPVAMVKVSQNIALNTVTVDSGLSTPTETAPGYICAVTVRIASYHPLAAPIPNLTRTCSDHVYLDPGGPDYGGDCGVVTGPAASAAISFPSSAVGTTISLPISNSEAPGKPAAFPTPDGRASHIWIRLKVPTSGRYTVVIGLWQDRSGPSVTMAASDTFDLEPVHEWSGQACALPAMRTQLPPPTDPPTPLLCPGAPPPLQ